MASATARMLAAGSMSPGENMTDLEGFAIWAWLVSMAITVAAVLAALVEGGGMMIMGLVVPDLWSTFGGGVMILSLPVVTLTSILILFVELRR